MTATATDGATPPASGVSAVRFEIKPFGAGAFTVFGTQTVPIVGSTYTQSLTTGSYADGPADLQVVVTDVAGNETTSAIRTINLDNDAPVVTLDDPGAAVGASVNLSATSSGDTTDVTFRYRAVGSGGAGTAIGSDAHGALHDHLVDAPRGRAAVGADRGRDRRRRQRLHERAARRPRRPHAAHRQRHGPAERRTPSAAPPSRSQRSPPTSPAPASRWSSGRSSSSAPAPSTSSRATRPRRTTAPGTRRARRTAPTEVRAVITDAAGNVRTTVSEPRHGRLDRAERHAHRSRRGRLGHGVARPRARRRRRPGRIRRLAGRWRHLDGDRLRHERAVRHVARHEHARRRALRPARDRLRLGRQPVDGLRPRERPVRQHRSRHSSPRLRPTAPSPRPPTRSSSPPASR